MSHDTIQKSFDLTKAWRDHNTTYIEGWLSTPTPDYEHHIIEPEAFLDAIESYFERRAPVSYIHDKATLPAGHLQKAALLRDGHVIKVSEHPTDPADFESLPATGSGVYVRGALTDPVVGASIKLGNTGGLSFTAKAQGETLPDGSKRFGKNAITHLIESTVAPYPVNPTAVITLSKAEHPMDEQTIAALLEKAVADLTTKLAPSTPPQETLTKAEVETLLAQTKTDVRAELEAELKKACELSRGESAGRQGTVKASEKNVIEELLTKAQAGKAFHDPADDLLLFRLTALALENGLQY